MASDWLLDLVACRADMVAEVGGKAANLGELIRLGAPVPGGFVVTTAAHIAGDSPALRAMITERYLALGAGPVAVRSSATAEDLPGATFAGQQDTYLDVVGAEAVVQAVLECWESLWTERAVSYRARLGIPPEEVSIAVVVQPMVPAEVAGVMFTANMITGNRDEYVIDASPGLGEAVVSGTVTPDHFVLDADGRVREWSSGTGDDSSPVLTAAALADLCRLARLVADHFGCPQDIEWAVADQRVWLLQARAMTALPPPPQHLNPLQARMSTVLGDYLTARPYPIDMTTWIPEGPAGMMGRIAADLGVTGVFERLFHETGGVVDRAMVPTPRFTPRLLVAPVRLLGRARRFPVSRWRDDPRWREIEAAAAELSALDLTSLPWRQLVTTPRRALDLMRPVAGLRIDFLAGVGLAVVRLSVAAKLLGRSALVGDLLQGAPTRTTAANAALTELAAVAARGPETAAAVRTGDLDTAMADPEFRAGFEAWITEYGGRETASPILITPPTLGELPEALLGLVAVLLPETTDGAPAPRADEHRAALEAFLAHPWLRRHQGWARRVVDEAREGVAFREDSHVIFTLVMPPLRAALLEIGTRLVDAGALASAEDVYHCRLAELEALPSPDAARDDLAGAVRDRAERRKQLEGVPLLNLVHRAEPLQGDEILVGIAASRGEATGPVRIINRVEEFSRLAPGEVLVCPYTNPSWTPLFQRAAAVVVDSGGPASHAAIVAREYGIPAVMGTRTGTTTLADGTSVRVDGAAGRVTRPR